MPLWVIYHTPETFVDNASRQAFAKDITTMYTGIGLPAFYVIVNFVPMPTGTMWKGGELPDKPFIRISVEHIAVHLENDIEQYHHTTGVMEKIMKPHIADKGYSYEYHVDETERTLWRVDGFIPPAWQSEAEKEWAKLNKAVAYEAKDGQKEQQKLLTRNQAHPN
ncbi:uncharacterized protein CTRU02_214604 [Colletotrichum truncatum]|uniref:Uncharacterized protein n=1 Tax=Colletotrichum truncatum TaxID=5467 RepID=A0ACC3YF77_COLTU|nr:uncharacterized protein CTRU02_09552 [Colletotrichum truncatum]KAF6788234.1 hypothetical protein CTRU02_09552 [Colletotrichum truncatum]